MAEDYIKDLERKIFDCGARMHAIMGAVLAGAEFLTDETYEELRLRKTAALTGVVRDALHGAWEAGYEAGFEAERGPLE